jgi:hypothetical protein
VLGLTPAFVATFQNRKNYAVLKHGRITAVTKQAEVPLFPLWVEDRGLSFLRAFLILNVIFVRMIPPITIWANRARADLRSDGSLGRYCNYSPPISHVPGDRAHGS